MPERSDVKLLAVIPARGGSKRIPRKNIRELCGRPMIAYTIDAALESGLFAEVVVSTDDPEIANTSVGLGANVPFLREPILSDDYTPVSLVTVDVLEHLDPEGDLYDRVVQLMPNCPLRTSDDIDSSYRQFCRTGSDSQISVTRYGWQNPWWAMKRTPEMQLEPLFEESVTVRSQDLPEVFCPTGAVWWAKTETLRQKKTFHIAGRTGWEITWKRGVDIDTEDDWALAEMLTRLGPAAASQYV